MPAMEAFLTRRSLRLSPNAIDASPFRRTGLPAESGRLCCIWLLFCHAATLEFRRWSSAFRRLAIWGATEAARRSPAEAGTPTCRILKLFHRFAGAGEFGW